MDNKIKINNIPKGYEIDQENSTVEKIVLVKKSISKRLGRTFYR